MNKSNFKKVAAIGICCTIMSVGVALAMPRSILLDEVSSSTGIGIENDLLEKQREIDQYVFVDHIEKVADAGFTVTHTGPIEDYVEIGILPYDEVNANFLYEIFGREKVKVVEGIQAVTLPLIDGDVDHTNTNNSDPSVLYENRIIKESNAIGLQVNGQLLQLDVEPFIESGRTLLPLRGVMESLGAKVEWHPEQSAVEVHTDDIKIQLVIGEDTARVTKSIDGTIEEVILNLEVPARIVEDRTFIPGRFVVETLGAKVEWNESLRVMIVETNGEGDIIGIERPIDFERIEGQVINENKALSEWYQAYAQMEGFHSLTDETWQYVLVSAGEKPTGGYRLQIDSITEVTPGTAYIHATLNAPGPDEMVTQAFTYPNALVRFKKEGIEIIQGDLVD